VKFNHTQILRLIFICLAMAVVMAADPITGATGWFHRSILQAGNDLVPAFIIIGAVIGMLAEGWRGLLAGSIVGAVAAIIVGNADTIASWGKTISLS
jgi:hypothetical protein